MQKSIFNNLYQYLTDQFGAFHKDLQEPATITEKRKVAFRVFKEKGFPSTKNEDWKYTNINRLLKDNYQLPAAVQANNNITKQIAEAVIGGLDAYRVVLLNGKYIRDLSDNLPEGMVWKDTEESLNDSWVQSHLGAIAGYEQSILALNTAYFTQCNFLHIAESAVIKKPVHVLQFYTNEQPTFIAQRLLVNAEKFSEATVVETHYNMSQAPVFINYVNEQVIAENSVLNSYIINNLTADAAFVYHVETRQQSHSTLHHTNVSFPGAAFIRNELNTRLSGMNTETNLWGLYLSGKDQLVDNHTIVDHQVPNCNSTEWYKGILQERSHGVFNGKIYVEKDAQKTNAFQQNNNLLLSEEATINTKPQLEIFADDVKCSHGATVGQMNEDALFYLKTRGIGEETAHHLLVEAFAYDVLSKIEIEPLQEYIRQLIRQNLETNKLMTA